jgi:hypothetical protein
MYPWREYVDAGGLMAYGPNVADPLLTFVAMA